MKIGSGINEMIDMKTLTLAIYPVYSIKVQLVIKVQQRLQRRWPLVFWRRHGCTGGTTQLQGGLHHLWTATGNLEGFAETVIGWMSQVPMHFHHLVLFPLGKGLHSTPLGAFIHLLRRWHCLSLGCITLISQQWWLTSFHHWH
jgi:hypothetical protein